MDKAALPAPESSANSGLLAGLVGIVGHAVCCGPILLGSIITAIGAPEPAWLHGILPPVVEQFWLFPIAPLLLIGQGFWLWRSYKHAKTCTKHKHHAKKWVRRLSVVIWLLALVLYAVSLVMHQMYPHDHALQTVPDFGGFNPSEVSFS